MTINRPVYLNKLIECRHNGMIKIITGMRRSGKSFLLLNLFSGWLKNNGIDENHIIQIDLESLYNEELRSPFNLLKYVDTRTLDANMHYILIDEVQLLQRFEEVLNTLLKKSNVDVYVTGSNARFLSKDVITTFRGRGFEIRIHPFSFAEYISAMQPENPYDIRQLNDYMQFGGLPQTVFMQNDEQKKQYLQQLFLNTYFTGIKERYSIRNDSDLEELINVIASSIGSLTNPLKIQNTFKSVKKSEISVNTIKNYLDYLQDAFLIEKAVRYDIKGRKYIETPAKYYFEDLGLRNARLNFRQNEQTHLMENLIYNELCKRGYSVDVGQVIQNTRNEAGKSERNFLEVDFVCNKGYDRIYIQSAYALPTKEKSDQEFKPLLSINDSFQKVVITGGNQSTYRTDDGILILNIFDFLIDDNSF